MKLCNRCAAVAKPPIAAAASKRLDCADITHLRVRASLFELCIAPFRVLTAPQLRAPPPVCTRACVLLPAGTPTPARFLQRCTVRKIPDLVPAQVTTTLLLVTRSCNSLSVEGHPLESWDMCSKTLPHQVRHHRRRSVVQVQLRDFHDLTLRV
jgi:hypothetical protein